MKLAACGSRERAARGRLEVDGNIGGARMTEVGREGEMEPARRRGVCLAAHRGELVASLGARASDVCVQPAGTTTSVSHGWALA
jgi:hypothetical protein